MAKAAAKAFIFFNCDEAKSESSMNIFYNHAVYKDTKASRKLLLKKIKDEFYAERVRVDDWAQVESLISEGDPVEAGNFIRFGAIKSVDCY